MELNLHANATTTPKIRAYIQRSRKKIAELATELGVSQTTIRRWRARTTARPLSYCSAIFARSYSRRPWRSFVATVTS